MVALARATAHDGRQRVLDHAPHSLQGLQHLRLALRQAIHAADAEDDLHRVQPWLWNAAISGDRPLIRLAGNTATN
ncbi:hypothetical protein [Thermomonospora cellulosilytica]|uniref:Uncharacterized protein n=1 Tax=Thermomonospora cellulosilytica TaxID=1411118 RepID=A0A7W3N2D4_9ACTN|nr:hypothetical protein [Thermomonospora cellulosilytica]MBA9006291.1 hypothetical protein [Thermomonospora cellulosilytica]